MWAWVSNTASIGGRSRTPQSGTALSPQNNQPRGKHGIHQDRQPGRVQQKGEEWPIKVTAVCPGATWGRQPGLTFEGMDVGLPHQTQQLPKLGRPPGALSLHAEGPSTLLQQMHQAKKR